MRQRFALGVGLVVWMTVSSATRRSNTSSGREHARHGLYVVPPGEFTDGASGAGPNRLEATLDREFPSGPVPFDRRVQPVRMTTFACVPRGSRLPSSGRAGRFWSCGTK
jgi:hypothetical protein